MTQCINICLQAHFRVWHQMCNYLLAGTYQDLAGNVGAGDVNATVAVSVLSTDTTDSSTTTTSSKLSAGDMAGIIIGSVIGAVFLALMCCLVSQRCLVIRNMHSVYMYVL